jgi:hypothetical protein
LDVAHRSFDIAKTGGGKGDKNGQKEYQIKPPVQSEMIPRRFVIGICQSYKLKTERMPALTVESHMPERGSFLNVIHHYLPPIVEWFLISTAEVPLRACLVDGVWSANRVTATVSSTQTNAAILISNVGALLGTSICGSSMNIGFNFRKRSLDAECVLVQVIAISLLFPLRQESKQFFEIVFEIECH